MERQYIQRDIAEVIAEAARYFSVITVTGPRQSGKKFLANTGNGLAISLWCNKKASDPKGRTLHGFGKTNGTLDASRRQAGRFSSTRG